MFQTIMVATGDSPWSHNALEYAIRLAMELKLELIITHIINDQQFFLCARNGAYRPEA